MTKILALTGLILRTLEPIGPGYGQEADLQNFSALTLAFNFLALTWKRPLLGAASSHFKNPSPQSAPLFRAHLKIIRG